MANVAADASHMVWATYLGEAPADAAQSIAVDQLSGKVWTDWSGLSC